MYLHHEKGMAKKAMHEYLRDNRAKDIVQITVHEKEIYTKLIWEHEREFELNGEMYDVMTVMSKGDSVIYRCIHDKKESSINKRIKSFIATFLNKEKGTDMNVIVYSDIFKILYPPSSSLSAMLIMPEIQSKHGGYDISHQPQFSTQPNTPPPKIA